VKRRVLIAALAVLLAALGAGAVLAYVHQAVTRGLAGQKAVTVLVALQVIPSGTTARAARQEGLLRSETLPAASVPANAVRSITTGLASLVTSAEVEPGQLLLRPMLVPAAQVTGGIALPSGMVAVAVALCVPEAVAGGVRPGSEVEVFGTYATAGGALTAGPDCSGSHQDQGNGTARTRVVLARAQVLSVGPAASGQASSAQGGTTPASTTGTSTDPASSQGTVLLTFAVSPAAAQRLIQVTVAGLPYLALLRP
jgi:pilus assembly protein CpaB